MRYKHGQTTLYLEDDTEFKAKFTFYPGCSASFNPMTGVGHDAEEPEVEMTEVNFGDRWESLDAYPQINQAAFHDDLMDAVQLMYEMEHPE